MTKITLRRMPWELAVCKLDAPEIPSWARLSPFLSLTVTTDEISLVCEASRLPPTLPAEREWECLRVEGVLDFSLIGILAGITAALAAARISVFAVSTHDTDYLLVKHAVMKEAIAALRKAGYAVMDEVSK